MPELSDSQRRKLVELEPRFAATTLVRALELKWEIHFQCTACRSTKTWRHDTMLGRAKALLKLTMAEIQRRTPCPRCGARMPAMAQSGIWDPQDLAEQFKWDAIEGLRRAGLDPLDYGYGWRPPTGQR